MKIRDMVIFLALDAVPLRARGCWYVRLCRWQMRRWHPGIEVSS